MRARSDLQARLTNASVGALNTTYECFMNALPKNQCAMELGDICLTVLLTSAVTTWMTMLKLVVYLKSQGCRRVTVSCQFDGLCCLDGLPLGLWAFCVPSEIAFSLFCLLFVDNPMQHQIHSRLLDHTNGCEVFKQPRTLTFYRHPVEKRLFTTITFASTGGMYIMVKYKTKWCLHPLD